MTTFSRLTLFAPLLALAACGPPPPPPSAFIEELPEPVLAIVAANQNLSTVQIRQDGCYWWQYRGPVETTFIPLLTTEGRMICTRPQGEATS